MFHAKLPTTITTYTDVSVCGLKNRRIFDRYSQLLPYTKTTEMWIQVYVYIALTGKRSISDKCCIHSCLWTKRERLLPRHDVKRCKSFFRLRCTRLYILLFCSNRRNLLYRHHKHRDNIPCLLLSLMHTANIYYIYALCSSISFIPEQASDFRIVPFTFTTLN